ncbi:MAG: hypothetical protein JWN62_2253 [Acidimicrobiales bacterium]|jgi:flagellar biogenesis protein FliO|nr:hypothetical protein [Acidimicrobiales bacterium]
MSTVNFGDLVERMVISLVVVLGLVYVAYRVVKRRQGASFTTRPAVRRSRRTLTSAVRGAAGTASSGSRRGAAAKPGLKIVGRQGLSRTTTVVAVQFAGRVFMVGTSEQAPPSVLAETDLETWTSSVEPDEELIPVTRAAVGAGVTPGRVRPTLLEALREVTARRV